MKQYIYSIAKPLPTSLKLSGRKYRLNLSFDRVLMFKELFQNSDFSDRDKTDIAYSWLVKSPRKAANEEKETVISVIVSDYLKQTNGSELPKPKRTAVNFLADSKYIYADFKRYYGIDLLKKRGKLSWWEFISMFDGLPQDSKIKEIMYIRTRELPEFNGSNLKEIMRVKELQEYYFLEENYEEIREEQEKGWDDIFSELDRKAGGLNNG